MLFLTYKPSGTVSFSDAFWLLNFHAILYVYNISNVLTLETSTAKPSPHCSTY